MIKSIKELHINLKAVGIVVEYNPFHNGHQFHLQNSLKESGADVVIAVMSGYFLQRGEPAVVSKWARTKMALQNGVDIVIELPYAFSTQSAEIFAKGAVSILDALFCQYLCFGSEQGDIEPFINTMDHLTNKKEQYEKILKETLQKGYSYPKATSIAFEAITADHKNMIDLKKPNNILGYQYIQAIRDLKSQIKPLTIKRIGADYHDETLHKTTIASATSIRKALFEHNDLYSLGEYMPNASFQELKKYGDTFSMFHQWENYYPFFKYSILTKSLDELNEIYEMDEGLQYRLKAKILKSCSFHEFLQSVKTKRYTWTRLQRLCVHILTNTKKKEMLPASSSTQAPYLRLLGMSQKGQRYLQKIKKHLSVPIIAKLSAFDHPLLSLDVRAAHVYSLALPEPKRSSFIMKEYSTPPIRYDEMEKQFL